MSSILAIKVAVAAFGTDKNQTPDFSLSLHLANEILVQMAKKKGKENEIKEPVTNSDQFGAGLCAVTKLQTSPEMILGLLK